MPAHRFAYHPFERPGDLLVRSLETQQVDLLNSGEVVAGATKGEQSKRGALFHTWPQLCATRLSRC